MNYQVGHPVSPAQRITELVEQGHHYKVKEGGKIVNYYATSWAVVAFAGRKFLRLNLLNIKHDERSIEINPEYIVSKQEVTYLTASYENLGTTSTLPKLITEIHAIPEGVTWHFTNGYVDSTKSKHGIYTDKWRNNV